MKEKLQKAKGDYWESLNGERHYLPLFSENELEKAEAITNALSGLEIATAIEFLDKVKTFLLQTKF